MNRFRMEAMDYHLFDGFGLTGINMLVFFPILTRRDWNTKLFYF